MALAVRRISASATLTVFRCENAVGPSCRALEQFEDETANTSASPWPGALMRKLGFLGVGFFFMLFSQAFGARHFRSDREFFLHAILSRLVHKQDHAMHETLELAERESSFD